MYLCIIRSCSAGSRKPDITERYPSFNNRLSRCYCDRAVGALPSAGPHRFFSSISFPFILIVMLKIHFCYIIIIHKEGLVDTEGIFPTICEFLLYVIQFSIKICSASILQENMHYSVCGFQSTQYLFKGTF